MSFEEFCNYMLEHLRDYLPEELRNATIERFDKSLINGGTGVGIVIREPDKDRSEIIEPKELYCEPENLYYEALKDTIALHQKGGNAHHDEITESHPEKG